MVCSVCDGENVWWQLTQPFVLIHFHILGVVDGEEFERVESDQNGANVSVDVGVCKPETENQGSEL